MCCGSHLVLELAIGHRRISPKATARGFEPLRAEPNGFRVHLLSRSDTLSSAGKWISSAYVLSSQFQGSGRRRGGGESRAPRASPEESSEGPQGTPGSKYDVLPPYDVAPN